MRLEDFHSAVTELQRLIIPARMEDASSEALQLCYHLDGLKQAAGEVKDLWPDRESTHNAVFNHFQPLVNALPLQDEAKHAIIGHMHRLSGQLLELENYSPGKGRRLIEHTRNFAKQRIQERTRSMQPSPLPAIAFGAGLGIAGTAAVMTGLNQTLPAEKAPMDTAPANAPQEAATSHTARLNAKAPPPIKRAPLASAPVIPYQAEGPRAQENVMPYCVYYGSGPLNDLARVKELLVIEPTHYKEEEIQSFMKLPNHPQRLAGYVTVVGINPTDSRLPEIQQTGVNLGKRDNYHGFIADVGDPKWLAYLKTRIDEHVKKGCTDIAFDTTDLEAPDKIIPAMQALAKYCEEKGMGCEIIGGYTVQDEGRLNKMLEGAKLPHKGVIPESVFTRYDSEKKRWVISPDGDPPWVMTRLTEFIKSGGEVNIITYVSPDVTPEELATIAEREKTFRAQVTELGGKLNSYISINGRAWNDVSENEKPREAWEKAWPELKEVTSQLRLLPQVSTHEERMKAAPDFIQRALAKKRKVNYKGKQVSVVLNNAAILAENAGDVVLRGPEIKTALDEFFLVQVAEASSLELINPGLQPITVAEPFAGKLVTDRGAILRLDALKPLKEGGMKEHAPARIRLVDNESKSIPFELSAEQMANAAMIMDKGARAGLAIPYVNGDGAWSTLVVDAKNIPADAITIDFTGAGGHGYSLRISDDKRLQDLQKGFAAAGEVPEPLSELQAMMKKDVATLIPGNVLELSFPGAASKTGKAR